MRSNRLWPVLIVFGVLLFGAASVEWLAAHREGYYEHIIVANSSG